MITRLITLTICLTTVVTLLAEPTVPDNLRSLVSREEIAGKVKEVAAQITKDYADKDLVIITVLKGALCLVADLIREIDLPLEIETVQCSSYGAFGKQRGELKVLGLDRIHVRNRDILVVDDIFDTGHTMTQLVTQLREQNPRSLKTCVLLNKEDVHKVTDTLPDYVLFTIKNHFVVGYGLDFKEKYRGLPGVYILEE